MKIRELIELLQQDDPERIVVLSRDPEGNGHAPLQSLSFGYRYDEVTGDIGLERLGEGDKGLGWTEDDVMKVGLPAVILTPRY